MKLKIIQGKKWESLCSPDKLQLSGIRYGHDVCVILNNELDMPDVPNEVFL